MSEVTKIRRPVTHRKDNMCPCCGGREREHGSAWCTPCRQAKNRVSEALRRARKKAGAGLLMPQRGRRYSAGTACNCGNSACNGMQCERARA
jgi:hypothetical protein